MSRPDPASERPRFSERFGFAIGDFAFNIHWNAIGLFLMFFYTDVMQVPVFWAGVTFFIASVVDAIMDPAVGALADRTRTRWGSYRPYLLFAAPLLGVTLPLAFSAPHLAGAALVVYALATHILLRVAYAFASIPYTALSARITEDAGERMRMAGLRMQCGAIGAVVTATLMPAMSKLLPGAAGWTAVAAAGGALSVAILWLCFALTRERVADACPPALPLGRQLLADARMFRQMMQRNRALRAVVLSIVLSSVAITMLTRLLLYYYKYELQAEAAAPLALLVATAGALLFIPLWVLLAVRTSKRTAWMAGSALSAIGFLGFYLDPVRDVHHTLFHLVVVVAGTSAFAVLFWAMLPDTVEENAVIFGRRDEGKTFGFAVFAQKTALGLNGLIAGVLLPAIGFQPNMSQSEATLDGLRALMTLVPLAGVVMGVWVMWRYHITPAYHAELLQRLRGAPAEAG